MPTAQPGLPAICTVCLPPHAHVTVPTAQYGTKPPLPASSVRRNGSLGHIWNQSKGLCFGELRRQAVASRCSSHIFFAHTLRSSYARHHRQKTTHQSQKGISEPCHSHGRMALVRRQYPGKIPPPPSPKTGRSSRVGGIKHGGRTRLCTGHSCPPMASIAGKPAHGVCCQTSTRRGHCRRAWHRR